MLNDWRDQERKTRIGGGGGTSEVEAVKSKLINRISQLIVRDFFTESLSSKLKTKRYPAWVKDTHTLTIILKTTA